MTTTRHYQVEATLPNGAIILCGVETPQSAGIASLTARRRLGLSDAAVVIATEIVPRRPPVLPAVTGRGEYGLLLLGAAGVTARLYGSEQARAQARKALTRNGWSVTDFGPTQEEV